MADNALQKNFGPLTVVDFNFFLFYTFTVLTLKK